MKIIYADWSLSDQSALAHVTAMVNALRAHGHSVLEIAEGRGAAAERPAGTGRAKRSLRNDVSDIAAVWWRRPRLKKLAARFRPDVIIERYRPFQSAGAELSQDIGIPLIYEVPDLPFSDETEHTSTFLAGLARRIEDSIFDTASVLLPETGALANLLDERDIPFDKIKVMPGAVDLEKYSPTETNGDIFRRSLGWTGDTVVGIVGIPEDRSKFDRILTIFAANPFFQDVRLLVMSSGAVTKRYRRMVQDLGIGNRVHFCEKGSANQQASYLACMDLAIVSDMANLRSPRAMLELMASEVATIAPDMPATREIIRHGHDALLYTDSDLSSLTEAISALIADPDMRTSIGHQGRRTLVDCRLTWDANADMMVELAEQLVPESPKTAASEEVEQLAS